MIDDDTLIISARHVNTGLSLLHALQRSPRRARTEKGRGGLRETLRPIDHAFDQ